MNQQAAATENALSGERTHRTFSIPITGDEELDFMAALVAIISEMNENAIDPRRVLQWFFQRTQQIHGLPMMVESARTTTPPWPSGLQHPIQSPLNTGTIGSPTTSPPYAQTITTAWISAFGNSTVGLAQAGPIGPYDLGNVRP